MSTDPAGEPLDRAAAEAGPLAVGMQVRAVNSEPVFSSDPRSGDVGEVVEVSPTAYLVRWQSTAETWMQREHLEPLSGGLDSTPLTAEELASPVAWALRSRMFQLRIASTLVFAGVFLWQWFPGVSDAVAHPTLRSVALGAFVLVVLVVGIVWGTKQDALNRAARADRKVAYAKLQAERAAAQAAREQDASGETTAS